MQAADSGFLRLRKNLPDVEATAAADDDVADETTAAARTTLAPPTEEQERRHDEAKAFISPIFVAKRASETVRAEKGREFPF